MQSPSTAPTPTITASGPDGARLSSARLSAVVEAAYILQAVRR